MGGGIKKKKKINAKDSADDDMGWIENDMIVWHHNFTTEALSWKGHDIGLLRFRNETYGKRAKGTVAPACLPARDYSMEHHRKHTYFAGFGIRFSPYCITDDLGPESQAVCGSYDNCSPRTRVCLLNFLYKGKKRKECITCGDTPSLSDPICRNLLDSMPQLEKERKKMHVFQDGNYVTTCYPRVDDERGWCTTKTPGQEEVEPEPNKGWGFCSHAPDQRYCNEVTPADQTNTTAFRVDPLSKDYCVTELGANLADEQPDVKYEEYQNVEEDYGIFCVADNHTHIYANDLYFEIDTNGGFEIQTAKQEYITQLRKNSTTKPHDINGRICFGDSGGPVFQLVYDPIDDVVRPVIVGLFSFVLWGQCHGRHEPAYINKVQFLADWIRLYISDEELCWIGADGRPVTDKNYKKVMFIN